MEVHPQLYRELKSFVYRRVKNLQDSEDIVHDVFIKAQSKQGQLKESKKLTAWMYTMTRNSIIDYFRLRQRTIDSLALDASESEYNQLNDCVLECMRQIMSAMPSPYREAIELADREHIPQKELATRLGISYSGVKSRVQRARTMLKEKMEVLYKIKTDGYGNVLVCEDRACGCNS